MKKLFLLAALASLASAAHAQTTPATDASGVPLINRGAPAPGGGSAPPAPLASPARRRPPLPPDQQAARQSQRLTQALGLSAAQQAQVRQIIFDQRENELAAQQQLQASGTRKGLGRARKAGRAQADERLRGVLTADQYSRYQQLLAQRKQGHGHHGQPAPAAPAGSVLD